MHTNLFLVDIWNWLGLLWIFIVVAVVAMGWSFGGWLMGKIISLFPPKKA
jgi:hypothetical protein